MSIPKRLILYRVSRYQKDYPVNLKYGCYSDTIELSAECKSAKGKRNRKMVRNLLLYFEGSLKKHEIFKMMKHFPGSSGIIRCWITSGAYLEDTKRTKGWMIKTIQSVFKTFKYLQQVDIDDLGSLLKDFKTFKNLLLHRSLYFLTLDHLQFSEEKEDLKPFLNLCQVAERRRCWPHLQSLMIDHLDWKENDPPGAHDRSQSLENLLEFLENFKLCGTLYQSSRFQIRFSESDQAETSEPKLRRKIFELQILPHLTHLETTDMKYCPKQSLDSFHQLENLKKFYLYRLDELHENFDMRGFKEIPNLQKIYLRIDEKSSIASYKSTLTQLQNVTNLASFSIRFIERPKIFNRLGTDICGVFSSLSGLRCLSLKLQKSWLSSQCPWLKDTFKVISGHKKLEQLTFAWEEFCFESSRSIFNAWCKCIGNLPQLSFLDLRLSGTQSVQDKDIRTLAKSIKKLKKMKKFSIEISKNSCFKPSIFVVLMRHIMNSFPILSHLFLSLKPFKITTECYDIILEAIHKMKRLNDFALSMKGKLEEGLDLQFLRDEISKRMSGWIEWEEP